MRSFYYDRKGQTQLGISSIAVIALALILAAVVLGLGGTILDKIKSTQSDNTAITPTNETLTFAGNNTGVALNEERPQVGSEQVWNASFLLTRGTEYNFTGRAIIFINISENNSDFNTFNVSYSYNFGSAARNGSDFGLAGVVTFAEFIPTIAIVAIAAIVIGIVLVMFGRTRREV